MNDRMMKVRSRLNINGFIIYGASLAWLFFGIYSIFDKSRLIVVMNAFLMGGIISQGIMYYSYIVHILKDDVWDRGRQFAISTCITWFAIAVVILASVIRHSGSEYNVNSTNFFDFLFRYLIVVSVTMQVFAPGYGKDLFYDTPRKTLLWASFTGLVVSIFFITMQAENFLDW